MKSTAWLAASGAALLMIAALVVFGRQMVGPGNQPLPLSVPEVSHAPETDSAQVVSVSGLDEERREPEAADQESPAPPTRDHANDRGRDADLNDFREKYEGWDRDRLRYQVSKLNREIGRVASPITHQKLASGDYLELSPLQDGEEWNFNASEYSDGNGLDPIVSTLTGQIDGTDMELRRVILVHPEDHPELLPLCEEKQWLRDRMRDMPRGR